MTPLSPSEKPREEWMLVEVPATDVHDAPRLLLHRNGNFVAEFSEFNRPGVMEQATLVLLALNAAPSARRLMKKADRMAEATSDHDCDDCRGAIDSYRRLRALLGDEP